MQAIAALVSLGFYPALDLSLMGFVWLLSATVLLDLFDISLPRGDSVGVAGALVGAGILIVGPPRAVVLALVSAIVAHVLRRRADSPGRLVTVLIARSVALVCGVAVLALLPASTPALLLSVAVPGVFLIAELAAAQSVVALRKRRPLGRLIRGNLRSQGPAIAAQWSASVLLLIICVDMGSWSLIPVVALLLLMRQSYAFFLDIRETYRTTVEVLVEAAESQDARRAGHAERTALAARAIGTRLGLAAPSIEQISYAALLHDLAELSSADDSEGLVPSRPVQSADVVAGVEFFQNVEPILRLCDGHGSAANAGSQVALAAMIVALASDIDCESSVMVRAAHRDSMMDHVAPWVAPALKARAVGAAIELGYPIPAVS